jgi:uncharacterized protein (DUF2141 family)
LGFISDFNNLLSYKRKSYLKYFYTFIIGLSLSVLLSECASRARPGGGPVDKTAPVILQTNPVTDTTKLKDVQEIKFVFSERMNESSVTQSLFISPPVEFESDWSGGDELTLLLKESLRNNQTYVVTIGSGAQDSRNNRMEKSFQLAFSTGPVIDRGSISGQIYGANQQQVFYVYAYRIVNPDSVDPTRIRADYLTQPDNKNRFVLNYLTPGTYRVFVIEDQNKNLLLDTDYEQLGIPYSDIKIDSSRIEFSPLNFVITRIDTTSPFISGIRALNKNTLLLRCSEPLQSLNAAQITISDTISNENVKILGFAVSNESANQYILYTTLHDSATGYRMSIGAITDSSGNIGQPGVLNYISSVSADTTGFRVESVTPADSAKNIDVNHAIQLRFSHAVDTFSVKNSFLCRNSANDTLELHWTWVELKAASIRPPGKFQPDETYTFKINTEYIRSLWNESLLDSIITHTFFMKPADEFGSISGRIEYKGNNNTNAFVYLQSLKDKKRLQIKARSDYTFFYEWLAEGNYRVGGFIDMDLNQRLSPGKLIPFIFAEPFNFSDDTIRIRKRWEFSDVVLNIPERE